MYKEKHILNHHTAGHTLSRYLDVYELDTVNCSADKTTGYKGDTVTITGTPAWNEKTSSYSVTGATLTGNQFDFTVSDVTAQANYETAKTITLQSTDGGSIAASRVSGFSGDSVTLSNTANSGYEFSAYTLTGANLTGSTFNLTGSDVTAKAWFYLPPVNAHVTYSMGNKFARDYLPNYSEFDEPDDVMNGYIEFGSSGSNFGTDRYFGIKYGTRLANRTDDSKPAISTTKITLNNAYIFMRDHCFAASDHYIYPCINYYFPVHSPYISAEDFFKQNWQPVGQLSGAFLSAYQAGTQSYSISSTCLNYTQNMLRFSQIVQPPSDGWTFTGYADSNARWSGRDMCNRTFIFDKQERVYYVFANGVASAKFSLPEGTYSKGNITAIESIMLSNETNTDAAIFNLQIASFSSLAEACRW